MSSSISLSDAEEAERKRALALREIAREASRAAYAALTLLDPDDDQHEHHWREQLAFAIEGGDYWVRSLKEVEAAEALRRKAEHPEDEEPPF